MQSSVKKSTIFLKILCRPICRSVMVHITKVIE